MAVLDETLFLWNPDEDEISNGVTEIIYGPDGLVAGKASIEVVNGNVVITVERLDEDRFGPVSLVVT